MVFSDEAKISIWRSDGIKYCWKKSYNNLQFHHLEFTVKHGGSFDNVLGCIAYNGPGYAY